MALYMLIEDLSCIVVTLFVVVVDVDVTVDIFTLFPQIAILCRDVVSSDR